MAITAESRTRLRCIGMALKTEIAGIGMPRPMHPQLAIIAMDFWGISSHSVKISMATDSGTGRIGRIVT
jgi:hypothetical protein